MTSSPSDNAKPPLDNHKCQVWIQETPITNGGVLSNDGLENIANHKYRAGSYTMMDTFLSPNLWEPLTNALPLWLAPNLVTTLGGLFCLSSTLLSISWLKNNDTDTQLPPWLYFYNAACMFAYYTLDCMDGKQARRTNSSTPLGQLFDHGMDCICNLSHLHLVQCIALLPPRLIIVIQCSLQFAFWIAQWEEYYTGILPHSAGQYCGVTEVNYSLALWSLSSGLFGAGIYRKVLINGDVLASWNNPMINWFMGSSDATAGITPSFEVRHLIALGWIVMIVCLVTLSWIRVYAHVRNIRLFASAISKLVSPALLCLVALGASDSYNQSKSASGSSPCCWLSLGLCFCLITIKIIVYSMAHMAYASFQVDILPFVVVVGLIHYSDVATLPVSPAVLFFALDCLYFVRLAIWIRKAIGQLCERLQIQLFRIKTHKA